ncbi:MAG: c-type cytochrome [Gallionella sp.]
MFRTKNIITACLSAAILFSAPVAIASDTPEAIKLRIGKGNPVKGKASSQLCQGCHGVAGISVEEMIPNLAGQYSTYLTKQVQNFKTFERKHQIMNAMSQTISDAELLDVSAFFASQKQMKGNGRGDNAIAKNLFLKGDATRGVIACVTCHGESGKGQSPSEFGFPVIGGQHKSYLVAQLNNWRSGERANSDGNVMNTVTKSLTDAEIEALAEYLSGL